MKTIRLFLTLAFLTAVCAEAEAQHFPSSSFEHATISGGIKSHDRNPVINGWGISFNLPDQPNYNNAFVQNIYLDDGATAPTNGMLLNMVVEKGYCWSMMSVNCSAPIAVNANVELQVKDGSGNDYWALLGVFDSQVASNVGGQATSGIVRGNWTGTCLCIGVSSVAENYSGRALAGVMVNASEFNVDGYFDNLYSIGLFVHKAKDTGVQVGGLFGGSPSVLPSVPYVFYNANQTKTLWQIANSDGTSASETIIGSNMITSPSGGFPLLQMVNSNAGANVKQWQTLVDANGSWTLRTVSDAQDTSANAITVSRSGTTPTQVLVSAPLVTSSYIKNNVYTVAALPTCNSSMEGATAGVSDAASNIYYAMVAGGGAWHVRVYCNSTNWIIH